MQALGRIQHHVTGRQFDALLAIHLFDHQFAAVIIFRLAQKQGGRQVTADTHIAALANGIIDMQTKSVPALVTVEQRRKEGVRQGRRHEHRMGIKRLCHQCRHLFRLGTVFGKLPVLLGRRRLVARGHIAIGPRPRIQNRAQTRHLVLGEDSRNVQQHVGSILGKMQMTLPPQG